MFSPKTAKNLNQKHLKIKAYKHLFMKKKGIEVGINFFIGLIIALVVFGFAMSFAFKFFGKAREYQRELDQNTKAQIESLIINSGDRVVAYPTQVELHSGQSEIIGLGILNILGKTETFNIITNCTKLIYADGTTANEEQTQEECSKIKIVHVKSVELKNNVNQITSITIKNEGAARGTYIIDIKVIPSTMPELGVYGGIQKVYLKSV